MVVGSDEEAAFLGFTPGLIRRAVSWRAYPPAIKVGVFPAIILFANACDFFAFLSSLKNILLKAFERVITVLRVNYRRQGRQKRTACSGEIAAYCSHLHRRRRRRGRRSGCGCVDWRRRRWRGRWRAHGLRPTSGRLAGITRRRVIAAWSGGVSRRHLAHRATNPFSRVEDTVDTPHAERAAAPRDRAELVGALTPANHDAVPITGLGRPKYRRRRCACRLCHRRVRAAPTVGVRVTDTPTLRIRFCVELPIGCDVRILCGVLRVCNVVPLHPFRSRFRRC